MRIACIYALMDCSDTVMPQHLLASLALWDYSEASVKYIFDTLTGDTIADKILEVLKIRKSLDRTDIYTDIFKGHKKSKSIAQAIKYLENQNLIKIKQDTTGGRPAEIIYLSENI